MLQNGSKESPKTAIDKKRKAVIRFGVFELAPSERQLSRNGEPVSIPPKVFDLLVVLAQNPGRLLEKEFLLKTVWPDTFVEEANLSVHVSTLRRALGDTPGTGQIIETVPKKGYRFLALVEEVAQPDAVPAALAAPALKSRTPVPIWIYAIGAPLLLSCLVMWADRLITRGSPSVHSLAVLPFAALNGDTSQDYLGLGMADALITGLSGIQGLAVRPTSSVLKYTNFSGGLAQVGRELAVDAVVEGRIQKMPTSVRVTVQLLRIKDGASLWADHFEDSFTNIFTVEDSIAEKVATALRMKLDPTRTREPSRPADMVAYQYLLQGRYLSSRRLDASARQAIEFFDKAIERDPEYAVAYAALANEYITRSSFGWPDQLTDKAKSAALRALALDPALPDAHVALGQILMRADWDWTSAAKAFDRAISLDPNNASAHAEKSLLLTAHSLHDEAIREMQLACKLDPGNASLRSDLAWTYNYARKFEAALANARAAVQIDPDCFTAHRELNKAYLEMKQFSKALDEVHAMAVISGGENRRSAAEAAQIYAIAGRKQEARERLARIESDDWHDPKPLYLIAVAHANLGDRDEAFRGLNAALDTRMAAAIWMNADPELDSLRSDPRFQLLVNKLRLTEPASRPSKGHVP